MVLGCGWVPLGMSAATGEKLVGMGDHDEQRLEGGGS